jgi:dTDP-4-amino-4,6-dideoxygalactose transaminase
MNDVTPTQHPLIKKHVAGQQTPISDLTGKRLFCISLHPLMTDDDIDYIAQSVADSIGRVR